jgi:site-specific DNA-methyltransferase (adenine-specific)
MKPYYEDSAVTIYHGDCREIVPTLGRFDLLLTDPPYGYCRKGVTNDGKDFLKIVGPALNVSWDTLVKGGSAFIFTSPGEVINLANAFKGHFKRMLWMYKPADCTYPLKGWLLKSEAILWFLKPGAPPNLFERHPFRHDCYVCNHIGGEGVEGHPTVKPLSVVSDLVMRCPEKGVILDPFAGSGTTGRAAKNLGRKAMLIEIEERYCEIAAKRMRQEVLPL